MQIRQVQHFIAVAETLSFSQAAERVNLTQQAVSKSVLQLERSLSMQLLERSKHSVAITESAKLLLPYMYDVLSRVEQLNDAVVNIGGEKNGHLRIGSTPTFLHNVVLESVLDFRKVYPETKITIFRGDFNTLSTQLQKGELDLVLSVEPGEHMRHLLTLEKIGECRNVVVVGSQHPLVELDFVTPHDLLNYPMLKTQNYLPGMKYLSNLFGEFELTVPAENMSVGSLDFAIRMLQRSDHWWVTPSLRVKQPVEHGVIARLSLEPRDSEWNLVMAKRRHSDGSKWIDKYADLVKAYLAELNAE